MKELSRMQKSRIYALVAFVILFLFAGCSTTYTENTAEVKKLRSDLTSFSASIKSVKVIFTAPQLYIDVYTSDATDKDIVNAILDKVKNFTTIDNITGIIGSVDTTVVLDIYTGNGKKAPDYEYYTVYYNSYDHTNDSPANVNAFKTWFQE